MDKGSDEAPPKDQFGAEKRELYRLGPKPTVAVDIFCVENGKVVEHWDVLQEEVSRR